MINMTESEDDRCVDIFEDADLVLALPGPTFLGVSSAVLAFTSPVFKAMLSPNVQEGNMTRSRDYPQEISLPNDEPLAMEILCTVLHGGDATPLLQCHSGIIKLDVDQVLNLAIVAAKYACAGAITFVAQTMLARHMTHFVGGYHMGEYANLAAAAYLLNLPHYFALYTRRLVLDETTSYSPLLAHRSMGKLPPYILRQSSSIRVVSKTP